MEWEVGCGEFFGGEEGGVREVCWWLRERDR